MKTKSIAQRGPTSLLPVISTVLFAIATLVSATPVSMQAYLKPSDGDPVFDLFGTSVCICGDTAVVGGGSLYDDVYGAVYVFVRNGTTWSEQAILEPSNPGALDGFGLSVAISGDTIVVGAPWEDSNSTGVNGNESDNSSEHSGAAYVFVRNGTTWSQQAYLKASNTGTNDVFGESVSISGDLIVVGAYGEDSNSTGINGDESDESSESSGAAYVFARTGSSWSQQAYLKASNTGINDGFGQHVAISGETIAIGAQLEDGISSGINGDESDGEGENEGIGEDSGAAYIFTKSAGLWIQQAYLKASNPDINDMFGSSIAIAGDTVICGAFREGSNATGVNGDQSNNDSSRSGAAYVFTRTGNLWSQQAYLKSSNPDIDDSFGTSVAASGNLVVVGASYEQSSFGGIDGIQSDNSLQRAGAAYIFVRNATNWTQQSYLKASDPVDGDEFGCAVAVSCGTIVAGAKDIYTTSEVANGAAFVFSSPLHDFINAMDNAGLTGTDADFDADPDHDGLANGIEWILSGNPTISSLNVTPAFSQDSTNFSLMFSRRDISECSTELSVQWSTDLESWHPIEIGRVSSQGVSVTENGTSSDTVIVAVPKSNSSSGRLFLRLKAVLTQN